MQVSIKKEERQKYAERITMSVTSRNLPTIIKRDRHSFPIAWLQSGPAVRIACLPSTFPDSWAIGAKPRWLRRFF